MDAKTVEFVLILIGAFTAARVTSKLVFGVAETIYRTAKRLRNERLFGKNICRLCDNKAEFELLTGGIGSGDPVRKFCEEHRNAGLFGEIERINAETGKRYGLMHPGIDPDTENYVFLLSRVCDKCKFMPIHATGGNEENGVATCGMCLGRED